MNIPNPHPSNSEQDHSCGPDCPTCQVKQLQPDQFEREVGAWGVEFERIQMSKAVAQEYANEIIGTRMTLTFPGTTKYYTVLSTRLENGVPDGSRGRVIAICEPVQQLEEIKPRRLPYEPPRMEKK